MRKLTGRFVDLSQEISPTMPIYPGDPKPIFEDAATIKDKGVNLTRLTLGAHTGTHVDAPSHFIEGGATIDTTPLTSLVGDAVALDLSRKKVGSGIGAEDLKPYQRRVGRGDIVLLYTGSSQFWGEEWVTRNFTYLEPSGAEWLVGRGVRTVGIDTLSVEKFNSPQPTSHKILLGGEVTIIEVLNRALKRLVGRRFFLVCLPLWLRGREAAPARALAFPYGKS